MAALTIKQPPVTRSVLSGAVLSGVATYKDVREDNLLNFMAPANAVTIVSPKTATGGANLLVTINQDPTRQFQLAGGGYTRTEPGPIYSVTYTPDAAVGGTSADQVTLTFSGRKRIPDGS